MLRPMQLKTKAEVKSVRGRGQAFSRPRPRSRPRIFVFHVSSRSRTVVEDSIPTKNTGIRFSTIYAQEEYAMRREKRDILRSVWRQTPLFSLNHYD